MGLDVRWAPSIILAGRKSRQRPCQEMQQGCLVLCTQMHADVVTKGHAPEPPTTPSTPATPCWIAIARAPPLPAWPPP